MFESFFGLAENPFATTFDPKYYFETSGHRQAAAGLRDALSEKRGLVVLSAEPGAGKTTVVRRVTEGLQGGAAQFAHILNPMLSREEFLEHVFLSLGIAPEAPLSKARLMLAIENYCAQRRQEKRLTALIVDEAHKLPEDVLGEVHFLANLETEGEKTLQILLVSQPELRLMLAQPRCRALKQRVALNLGIDPLTQEEAQHYIHFRWTQAGGGQDSPFSIKASAAVWEYGRGLPRLINTLCEHALRDAFLAKGRRLTPEGVRRAAHNLDLLTETEAGGAALASLSKGDSGVEEVSKAAMLRALRGAPSESWEEPTTVLAPSRGRAAYRTVKVQVPASAPLLPFEGTDSNASQQYKMVRTKIAQHPNQPRILTISSPGQGDGRTVNAVNIAAALALKEDARVLLVDADFRHSCCGQWLGVRDSPGLTDVLAGKTPLEEAVVQVEQCPNLHFLPVGDAATNAAELLDSPQANALFSFLRSEFAFTIIDGPPVGSVADYDILQALCDGVLIVVRPDHTKRSLYSQALEAVSKEKLLGVLLTEMKPWLTWRPEVYA
jgi:capsular exopolysaccharide synthesis family protein